MPVCSRPSGLPVRVFGVHRIYTWQDGSSSFSFFLFSTVLDLPLDPATGDARAGTPWRSQAEYGAAVTRAVLVMSKARSNGCAGAGRDAQQACVDDPSRWRSSAGSRHRLGDQKKLALSAARRGVGYHLSDRTAGLVRTLGIGRFPTAAEICSSYIVVEHLTSRSFSCRYTVMIVM